MSGPVATATSTTSANSGPPRLKPQRAGVVPRVRQREDAGMPQHVGMDELAAAISRLASPIMSSSNCYRRRRLRERGAG
jgi:hypothetical protein